jgi:hypothetical protein
VAGDEGIMADSPIVGDEMEVAMADSAVGDGNLHLLGAELARVIPVREKFCSRCVCCKSLNLSHDRSEFLIGDGRRAG